MENIQKRKVRPCHQISFTIADLLQEVNMTSCMHLTMQAGTRLQPRGQSHSILKCRSSPLAGLSTRQKRQIVNMIGTMPPGGGAGPPGKAIHMCPPIGQCLLNVSTSGKHHSCDSSAF